MIKEMSSKNIVLYADDDYDDLDLVKQAFNQHSKNVQLVTVTDGFQLLSYLKNLSQFDPSPCLIILDINMPRLNGKDTLVELRKIERFKDVPVMLFTTSSQPIDKEFAERYNAGFLTKPINVVQLDSIADRFIEHCTDEVRRKISPKAK